MKLAGRLVLQQIIMKHPDLRGPIASWIGEVEAAKWKDFHELKNRYPSASILENSVVIFNIKGNKYRLETVVAFSTQVVLVRWGGTHAEYSKR